MIEMEEDTSEWKNTLCSRLQEEGLSFSQSHLQIQCNTYENSKDVFTEREQPIFKFVRTTEDSG